ncbi:MAG: filamentation induced by cAMP protein Fic [Burkholderia sp.]|jgi:hypothetical protein|nr:filamentation induced by cAMP protein Fic [Burkholderia sp.]
MSDWIGFKWVAAHTRITPTQPFAVESQIGTARRTVVTGDTRNETYQPGTRPDATIPAHLTFAFRHEIVHLEFLARLFAAIDPRVLEEWIRREPTGSYARRSGFFYEWLTGRRLDVPDTPAGNYVDALDAGMYIVASRAANVQRWRVRDNLPGIREFCPVVVRTDSVQELQQYDCAKALKDLEVEFGADILQRSAVWLTIKESRASFAIEHEERQVDRIRRFAAVMERRCGLDGDPLTPEKLTELQTEILGTATRYGMRKSPVFVGHTTGYTDVVDYIGPHWERAQEMLTGLQSTMARTQGASSIVRATIASFGFVYIHPMADGNGRISRFLVNDVLRRDGAVLAPFILPISATITDSSHERVGYDRALERFSRPLMQAYSDRYSFGVEVVCDDGVQTNFHFDAYDEALPAWRYPDLTHQAEYVGHVIRLTIESEMSKEATILRDMDRARRAVKNYLEGPNTDIDQIIRSVRQNRWVVSNKLARNFPQLADSGLAEAVTRAVREVLDPDSGSGHNEPKQDGESPGG